jgi:phospholipase/lecithinase/hemolysin
MEEYTLATNQIWKYQVPYEVVIAQRYPGASIAIFDVHTLLTNIYYNPSDYLNGTSPLNTTGYYRHCNVNGTDCVNADESLDSFLWYDELHPTNRTDQVIASEFINVVNGNSTYATYWQGGGVGY